MKGYLQMSRKNKASFISVATGALALGWVARSYRSKVKQKSDYESILQKLRNAEQKLYNDGLTRANEIDLIKKEVQEKVSK